MSTITRRVVLHFPGFEPLDAQAHRERYARAARQSAEAWNFSITTSELENGRSAPSFTVDTSGPDWRTASRIHVLDHNGLISGLRNKPLLRRIAAGYANGVRVALYGGVKAYFRHAWRFGLFFLFPFLLMAIGLSLLVAIAALPAIAGLAAWQLIWSVPLALLFFVRLFLPAAEKLHTLHLFADWELAVSLANLDDAAVTERLLQCIGQARDALLEDADEYLVTSHSMGSSIAVHVIGALVETDPELFRGKKIVFASLGSGLLQCALLRPAEVLRRRTGSVARCPEIFWLDVQCLTDSIHFYKAAVVAAAGHPDAPPATAIRIRFKNMLTENRYRRIRRQFLRVHRQYVLGSDRRSMFDFTLLTAGPLPAHSFATYSSERLPPISQTGALDPGS